MTAKELSKLITTGRKLKKFIKETLPKIREEFQSHSNSGIDKHTDGFGRRESIQSMNISNLCYFSFWQLWKWRHIFGYSKYGY